jgi:hypothetical protein
MVLVVDANSLSANVLDDLTETSQLCFAASEPEILACCIVVDLGLHE